jgi:hypothetical protein
MVLRFPGGCAEDRSDGTYPHIKALRGTKRLRLAILEPQIKFAAGESVSSAIFPTYGGCQEVGIGLYEYSYTSVAKAFSWPRDPLHLDG